MLAETAQIVRLPLDFLPLESYDGIVEDNALRMDWRAGPVGAEPGGAGGPPAMAAGEPPAPPGIDYIIGNPPFVGARLMSADQKADLAAVFGPGWRNLGNLDYVSGWYKKAADLMTAHPATRTALVSTNSVCQGEAPAVLWKPLVDAGISIDFAHRTFRWDSESTEKAHVHCVIVGFSRQYPSPGGAGDPPAEKASRNPFAGGPPAPPGE